MSRAVQLILLATAGALPGVILRFSGEHLGVVPDTAIYGLAIVSASFLLSWGAEASEIDIPQAVAVAFIALIAVLPEYAVDLTFAWKAGKDPEFAHFAVANMTGANRLLIGVGWPLVFFLFWWVTRGRTLRLERAHAVEVVALAAATLYSFSIAWRAELTLIDTAVLFTIFLLYVSIITRAPEGEPELVGPALAVGSLPRWQRRTSIVLLLGGAATAILASAEPFAEGLVESGGELGIDEFLLVQWLAPFASEAPEFLIAAILAWRGRATMALGALLSSKVNQWTLLLGGLPVAYAISHGDLSPLPMDVRQQEEVLLTASQSLFAVGVLISLSLERREALGLISLFALQFAIPVEEVRLAMSALYIVLGLALLVHERGEVLARLRDARIALRNPRLLAEEPPTAAAPAADPPAGHR